MLQPQSYWSLQSPFFQLQVYQVAKLHGSANGHLVHHMPWWSREFEEYTRRTVDGSFQLIYKIHHLNSGKYV